MTRRALTLAWALPALALVLTCGLLGLFEPTETRYAEIAREMLRSGDWLVPRLNGIAHFHKPPIAYWGSAAGMALAGVNEWGARLFGALAAGFALWACSRMARRLEGDATAAIAPLVLASTALFAALSRQLSTDLPLTACTAGFWVAYLASRDGVGVGGAGAAVAAGAAGAAGALGAPSDRRAPLLPFVALAAGFMTKGPIIFLHTLLPLLGVTLLARGARAGVWRPLRSGLGWGLFALLALPWYLIVVFRTRGLLQYFLENQMWARYATTTHRRAGPWYYFAGVVFAGALPWSLAAFGELARRARAAVRGVPFETALLLSWGILPAVFFSTSGSKLPAYVLPDMIPVAILVAAALVRAPGAFGWATALPVAALAVALEWFGPRALAGAFGATHAARLDLPPAAHAAAALWLLAAVALLARRPRAGAWGAWAGLLALLFAVVPLAGPLGSPRPLARLIARARDAHEPLVELGEFNAGLPFYLETRAVLVEVPRDLEFGAASDFRSAAPGDSSAEISRADLAALARSERRLWLYAKRGQAEAMAEEFNLVAEPVATWRGREMTILRPME